MWSNLELSVRPGGAVCEAFMRDDEFYFHQHPEQVPACNLLPLALPVSTEDFESGEIGIFLSELGSQHPFDSFSPERLQECFATGFGYASWEAIKRREADRIAEAVDLPGTEFKLMDVVAWRIYAAGFASVLDAFTGVYSAWSASDLSLRRSFGPMGITTRERQIWECCQREIGMTTEWRAWEKVSYSNTGKVRIRWAAELIFEIASSCWTHESGISIDVLNEELRNGSLVEPQHVIERSWFFGEPWPIGLEPIQYADGQGATIGYGWTWPELGLRHSRVFKTHLDFKNSAVALWNRQSTKDFARTELPSTLVQVHFENPWDRRTFERESMRDSYSSLDSYSEVEVEIVPTDGSQVNLGQLQEIDGEVWTRAGEIFVLRPEAFEEVLGFVLPTMEEVNLKGEEVPWLRAKVPYAFDLATYETACRLWCALDELRMLESDWLDNFSPDAELSWLMTRSAINATPVCSRESEAWLEDRFVASYEMPSAGRELILTYPELTGLTVGQRGDYALAFYGKDGLRHDRSHAQRDLRFMAYATLRNLGLDPDSDDYSYLLAIFRIVRLAAERTPNVWEDKLALQRFAFDARRLCISVQHACSALEGYDQSLRNSRLALLVQ